MSTSTTLTLDEVLASDQVPSLPEVALRIIEIAQQEDPDTQELISVVRTDPAIAGRILKFANSALFGLRHRPTSVDAAVPMLGTTLVRTLTLGFSLARQTPVTEGLRPWFAQLWREALFQAASAELLAERVDGADPPTWFLGGLLQDVGQLAMLNVAQVEYFQAVLDRGRSESRIRLEREHFGFTHVDVSVALCKKWNLETDIIAGIAAHHRIDRSESEKPNLQLALATASCCSEYMEAIHDRLETTRKDVEECLIRGFGILPHEIAQLLAEVDKRSSALAAGFSVNIGDLPPRERILARAQSVLREIALDSQLRKINGDAEAAEDSDVDRSELKEWLDDDLSTYNRRFLDRTLPEQLTEAHANGAAVGLLKVDFSSAAFLEHPVADIIAVIKESVRPSDSVVRTSPETAVVILPGLNYDLLNGIAGRIQQEVNERLDITDDDEAAPTIGGVVVLPAGRKVTKTDIAIKALDASTDQARKLSSSRVAFQLLMGKKAKPLNG